MTSEPQGAPPTTRWFADLPRRAVPPARGRGIVLGAGVLWMTVGLATGELQRWPYLVAKYGLTFVWLLVPAALLPFPTALAIGRYTLLTGESVVVGFRRVHHGLAALLWVLTTLSLFGLGVFAAVAGDALAALTQMPGPFTVHGRMLVWAVVVIVVLVPGVTRPRALEYGARLAALATVAAVVWACAHAEVASVLPTFLAGLVGPSAPSARGWDVHDAGTLFGALAMTGLTGFWILLPSYWIRAETDGTDHAAHVPDESLASAAGWSYGRRRLVRATVLGVAGSCLVTAGTCLLAYALCYPRGLVPAGDPLAVLEVALRDAPWGARARMLVLTVALALAAVTWLAAADGLRRLAADAPVEPGHAQRHARSIALAVALVLTAVTTLVGAPSLLSALGTGLGFVGGVVLPPALYVLNHRRLAPALPAWARPSRVEALALGASALVYVALAAAYGWLTFG